MALKEALRMVDLPVKDAMPHSESHRTFSNGICLECAGLGKQQGIREERERIYAWLAVILPEDVLQATGGLIREALYGSAEHPPERESGAER